jgi:hypothetical protein
MTATIYVSKEALATANQIKDLDYYDRLTLVDDQPDVRARPGYYLKNANSLPVAELPSDVKIAVRITPDNPVQFSRHVTFPSELRGCVFAKAPHLPKPNYAEIISYWSGKTVNAKDGGAVYFQNPLNECLVVISGTDGSAASSDPTEHREMDDLLSEGVVVAIVDLGALVASQPLGHFIEIALPVDEALLSNEPGSSDVSRPYDAGALKQKEHIYLRVLDVLRSPDPDYIAIDVLRGELLDYGYWY